MDALLNFNRRNRGLYSDHSDLQKGLTGNFTSLSMIFWFLSAG